jgi:hypothetical protein
MVGAQDGASGAEGDESGNDAPLSGPRDNEGLA